MVVGPAAIAAFLGRRRRMPESNLKMRAIGAGPITIGVTPMGFEPTTEFKFKFRLKPPSYDRRS
jgi:hypothetical protein